MISTTWSRWALILFRFSLEIYCSARIWSHESIIYIGSSVIYWWRILYLFMFTRNYKFTRLYIQIFLVLLMIIFTCCIIDSFTRPKMCNFRTKNFILLAIHKVWWSHINLLKITGINILSRLRGNIFNIFKPLVLHMLSYQLVHLLYIWIVIIK